MVRPVHRAAFRSKWGDSVDRVREGSSKIRIGVPLAHHQSDSAVSAVSLLAFWRHCHANTDAWVQSRALGEARGITQISDAQLSHVRLRVSTTTLNDLVRSRDAQSVEK